MRANCSAGPTPPLPNRANTAHAGNPSARRHRVTPRLLQPLYSANV